MDKKIVITALSVVSPYGLGIEEFSRGYHNSPGYPLSDLISVSSEWGVNKKGALVPDYDLKSYLGRRGLRNLDRLTANLSTAMELIHHELGFEQLDQRRKFFNDEQVSIVLGTPGPIQSIADFDLKTVLEPDLVQPGLFPNVVFNSSASYAAIRKFIKASCVTVTNGEPSSLDAIRIGSSQLLSGRANLAFVGGAIEMTPWHIALCAASQEEIPILSEGVLLLSLENANGVLARKAPFLGTVCATTSLFSSDLAKVLKEGLRRISSEAFSDYESITHVYANRMDLMDEVLDFEHVTINDLSERFGYLGPLFGVTALISALVDLSVPQGARILIINTGMEGNLTAALFTKGI